LTNVEFLINLRLNSTVKFEFKDQIRPQIQISNSTFSVKFRIISSSIRTSSELTMRCRQLLNFLDYGGFNCYKKLIMKLKVSNKAVVLVMNQKRLKNTGQLFETFYALGNYHNNSIMIKNVSKRDT